jgi:hypothetical protein
VVEVVHGPRRQQLSERHFAELGMQPALLEGGGIVHDELAESIQVLRTQCGESLDERRERNVPIALDMGESVEGIEGPTGAVAEDDLGARNPVVELGRDQVTDDVAGRPSIGRVGFVEPAFGQPLEEVTDYPWSPLQELGCLVEECR